MIRMLKDINTNMSVMQRKVDDIRQKWEERLETKYTTPKRKILLEGITQIRRCSRTEQGIGRKWKDLSKTKHRKEKMTDHERGAWVAWGIISSDLTCVARVPERGETRNNRKIYIWRSNGQFFFFKFDKNKDTDSRSSINPSRINRHTHKTHQGTL